MPSLPPTKAAANTGGRTKRRRRQGLSRKQTKRISRVHQQWEHLETGMAWRIKHLHRGDGGRAEASPLTAPVVLERPGDGLRFLTYGELGSQYRLISEPGEE